MTTLSTQKMRIAVLDFNNGVHNQGLDCIVQISKNVLSSYFSSFDVDVFDVRQNSALPDFTYDIYIGSGGPGSPLDSETKDWQDLFFNWFSSLLIHNENALPQKKKFVYFICYSFQVISRYFKIGNVCRRKSTAFGVFPTTLLEDGLQEPIFQGLENPFFALDSRDFQLIEIDDSRLQSLGAKLLAIEKERPHVPLERAAMAIRFTPEIMGSQFHPEADAESSRLHMSVPEAKQMIINNYGEEKYNQMMVDLEDPSKIKYTQHTILPNFIRQAIFSQFPTLQ